MIIIIITIIIIIIIVIIIIIIFIIIIIIIIIVMMPGYFTHLKKEASIICDDVTLIMEACFNLRYCGFTRLMGFIQGSLTLGCDIELTLDVLVTVC